MRKPITAGWSGVGCKPKVMTASRYGVGPKPKPMTTKWGGEAGVQAWASCCHEV